MFDHPDDDIYDGILEEDDEEVPRVQLEFLIEEVDHQQRASDTRSGVRDKAGTAQSNKGAAVKESKTTVTQKMG